MSFFKKTRADHLQKVHDLILDAQHSFSGADPATGDNPFNSEFYMSWQEKHDDLTRIIRKCEQRLEKAAFDFGALRPKEEGALKDQTTAMMLRLMELKKAIEGYF